jgi:hypothetical protein
MKHRLLPTTLLLAVLLPGVPSALAATTIECPPDDGRERLTTDGFELDFEAPYAKTYELVPTAEHTGAVKEQRDAKFPFTADFTPYTSAKLAVSLNWTEQADHDLFVLAEDGSELAVANARTVFDGPETIEIELNHCDAFSIIARSGPGHPGSMMSLDVAITPGKTLLACGESDPAPGCAGKLAGEAPDLVPDTRTRLYLGGSRPGQASQAGHYVWTTGNQAGEPPLYGALAATRPTGGTPNTYTRLAAGFDDQYQNPFQAHFSLPLEGKQLTGDVNALVYASSQTMNQGGTLNIDLWADGSLLKRVEFPGATVPTVASPLTATFTDIDVFVETELTLTVSAKPAAGSTGPGNPGDAEWTIYYDGVQFPSRVTLEPPA